jgi:hypothetical protein
MNNVVKNSGNLLVADDIVKKQQKGYKFITYNVQKIQF